MIAVDHVEHREPVPGGELVIRYITSSLEGSHDPGPVHGAAWDPPALLRLNSARLWTAGSAPMRLLAAAIADALADRDFGGPIWQSVLLQVEAEAAGRVSLSGRELPATPLLTDDERRLLLGPRMLDELLGYVDQPSGGFVPGLARLTPQERDAVWYWLEPAEDGELRDAPEIRDLMAPRRRRFGSPLSIETVERYLRTARSKLSGLGRS